MDIKIRELLTLHFLNDGVRTTFIILLPLIAKEMNFNYTFSGFLGSSQTLTATLLAIPSGFLTAKVGGFRLLLTLLLIYSLAAFGVALSPNTILLGFTFFAAAFGFGMFHTLGFTLVAKTSTTANIGLQMGNFTSIGEIGRVAIPPLAIFLASFLGWRAVMTLIAISGLLFFIFFSILQQKNRQKEDVRKLNQQEGYKDFLKAIAALFTKKQFVVLAITGIVDSLASSPIHLFLPFLLVAKGVSAANLSILMGAFFIGSLIGKSLLGRSVDRFGNKRIFIISELSMALLLVFVPLSSGFPLLLVLSLLLGIFTKGTSPVVQTMFSEATHKDHYHKVYATTETLIQLAGFTTQIAMGVIADKIGIASVFYLSAILGFLAVIPLLGTRIRGKRLAVLPKE